LPIRVQTTTVSYMKTETAINLAGSATKLAALLGITPSAVTQWKELVPEPRYWQLRILRPKWFTKAGEAIGEAPLPFASVDGVRGAKVTGVAPASRKD